MGWHYVIIAFVPLSAPPKGNWPKFWILQSKVLRTWILSPTVQCEISKLFWKCLLMFPCRIMTTCKTRWKQFQVILHRLFSLRRIVWVSVLGDRTSNMISTDEHFCQAKENELQWSSRMGKQLKHTALIIAAIHTSAYITPI